MSTIKKTAKFFAATLASALMFGSVSVEAQWTFVSPRTVYTTVSDYHVGIGTTTPQDILHIHGLSGSVEVDPKPIMRITAPVGDHCISAGLIGIAYADNTLATGSRMGDFVLQKKYRASDAYGGECGDNIFLTTDAPNGSIFFSTASSNKLGYQRVEIGDVNGHTYVDIKSPKAPEHYGNNNAMLRFYTSSQGGSINDGRSLTSPWIMGIDSYHSLTGISPEPIFRIGLEKRNTVYPGVTGGPSGLFTDGSDATPFFSILRTGQVIIGKPLQSSSDRYYTTDLTTKLSVDGTIVSNEFWCVHVDNWPDFVFSDDYKLASLEEVERHIKEKKHLPGLPSESEVGVNGVGIVDMQAKMLQKIEELTLYVIEQQKKIQALEAMVNNQK